MYIYVYICIHKHIYIYIYICIYNIYIYIHVYIYIYIYMCIYIYTCRYTLRYDKTIASYSRLAAVLPKGFPFQFGFPHSSATQLEPVKRMPHGTSACFGGKKPVPSPKKVFVTRQNMAENSHLWHWAILQSTWAHHDSSNCLLNQPLDHLTHTHTHTFFRSWIE